MQRARQCTDRGMILGQEDLHAENKESKAERGRRNKHIVTSYESLTEERRILLQKSQTTETRLLITERKAFEKKMQPIHWLVATTRQLEEPSPNNYYHYYTSSRLVQVFSLPV